MTTVLTFVCRGVASSRKDEHPALAIAGYTFSEELCTYPIARVLLIVPPVAGHPDAFGRNGICIKFSAIALKTAAHEFGVEMTKSVFEASLVLLEAWREALTQARDRLRRELRLFAGPRVILRRCILIGAQSRTADKGLSEIAWP